MQHIAILFSQRSWKLNLNNGWPFTTIAQIEDVYLWDENNSNCLFDHLLTDTNSTNNVTLCTQLCRIFCLKKTTPVGTKFTQGKSIQSPEQILFKPFRMGKLLFLNRVAGGLEIPFMHPIRPPQNLKHQHISHQLNWQILFLSKHSFFSIFQAKHFMDKIVGTKLGKIGLAVKVFLFSDLFRGLFFPDILQDFILASQNGFQSLHLLGWKPNKIHLTLKPPWIFR